VEQNVRQLIRKIKKDFASESIAVGIYHEGKEQYITVGNRAPFMGKIDENTVYPIASASKAFIAASVMILVERGLLDLDKPVVSYLDGFELWTKELTKQLTVRDALCHQSGLPRHDVTLYLCDNISLHEMVQRMRYLEPAYPLRARFHYQNHMFAMLSVLVEKVSGMSWGEFVQKEILRPLGMTRSWTVCRQYESVDKNYAKPFATIAGFNIPIKPMRSDCGGGAGAISASVKDLLQWAKLNLNKGLLPQTGERIFNEESDKELHSPQMVIKPNEMRPYTIPGVNAFSYGLGWFIEDYNGTKVVHHGGTLMGFKSLVGFIPGKDFAFSILVNQNGSHAPSAIAYSLFDDVLGIAKTDWSKFFKDTQAELKAAAKAKRAAALKKPAKAPGLEDCAGTYSNPAYGELKVFQKGNILYLLVAGIKLKLRPSTIDEFVLDSSIAGMTFPCHFERKDGKCTGVFAKLDEDLASYIRFDKV
jgi:CubicO group peptidase (beta-lactamase class C family)